MPFTPHGEKVAPNEEKREVLAFRCMGCGSRLPSSSLDCPKCKGEMLGSIRMTPHRIVIFAVALAVGALIINAVASYRNSTTTSNSNYDSGNYNTFSNSTYNSNYQPAQPSYNANDSLLPENKENIKPLYDEVQRLKKEHGMTDREAINKILREAGETP